MGFLRAAALAVVVLWPVAAVADDWTAIRLRGDVQQLVGQEWAPLHLGDVVPDSRVVRTMGTGHVQLERGRETIDLLPDTQIRIFDRTTLDPGKPYTTVKQEFGTVAVEANVEQVQHFEVDTPYTAAVVKGTKFTVTSGKTGAEVSVQRGHVAVQDVGNRSHVTISVGQSATVDNVTTGDQIAVQGLGALPAVLSAAGKPLPPISPSPKGPVPSKIAGPKPHRPGAPPLGAPTPPAPPKEPDKAALGAGDPPSPPAPPKPPKPPKP